MRAYVLTDRSLARHAGRFVWLSLDTENAKNAAATKQLGVAALPTYFVLDPRDQHVAIRWVGGGTVAQMDRFFDAAAGALDDGAAGDAVTRELVAADRAYGQENYAEAIPHYRQALAAAPEGWPGYARAVEALLFSFSMTDAAADQVALAEQAMPRLVGTPSYASAAAAGLDGAVELPADAPGRAERIAVFERACQAALADSSLHLAGDDLSGLYFSLEGARDDAGDSLDVRALEEQHVAMLEARAAAARTPEQRAVYDSHRLSLYLELGTPGKAVPMLQQSERDFPTDYNPSQRLAIAYRAMKRWPEALAASDRAMAHAYGPRQFQILQTRADILVGLGDKAAAQKVMAEAVAKAEAMPDGQRSPRMIDALKKKLEALN